jgi:hypothetical protein
MRHLIILTFLATLNLGALHGAEQGFDLEQAKQALEGVQAVEPKQPRKVLVYSVTNGKHHQAVEWGKAILPLLGEKTGAYEAVLSIDPAMFDQENLAQFDAVIFNNTTRDALLGEKRGSLKPPREERRRNAELEEQRKQNLLQFIRQGGGFVGIHAATDTYKDWPEYVTMIGGKFDSHPWRSVDVVIDVVDPDHPLTRGIFDGDKFEIKEEIYIHRDNNDEWIQPGMGHVLLELNIEESTSRETPTTFVPVSWINTYGEGRVYYNSLGHTHYAFQRPDTLQALLRGIQWATGDIPAPVEPGSNQSASVE